MNAQQLKNSILQLAVQGKLVPQDPNDEPASKLVERIRVEKEKLIKEKKIKPDKNPSYIFKGSDNLPYEKVGDSEPVCIAEEVPFEIPDSWEWVRLNEAVLYTTDYVANGSFATLRENVKNYKMENYAILVKTQDFSNNFTRNLTYIDKQGYEFLSKSKLYGGELMLSNIGASIGKAFIIPQLDKPMSLAPNSIIVKCINDTMTQFIKYLILSPFGQDILKNFTAGTAMPKFSKTQLRGTLLPLPPLAEQQRIVDKLKELEPYIKEYDVAYEKIEKLNNNFPEQLKKSILQEAVQGKLVPQNPKEEPASILIERIREEKQKLIKEKKIKKDKNESYIFIRDNSHYEKNGSEERCIDDEIPFEIPDSWEWCYLNNVTSQIHYGYTASASSAGNVKLTRITDIQNNRVNWETVPFCLISEDNLKKYKLENRDILIARTGGTIGKTYIVRNLSEKAVFASYLIRAIPLQLINEEYLKLFMESPLYWEQLKAFSMGTGQPNVNGQSLSKLKLPLPPLEEQKRIVEKIQTLMPIIEIL